MAEAVRTDFDEWPEFQKAAREYSEKSVKHPPVWRGQSDPTWPVQSPWERYAAARIRAAPADRDATIEALKEEQAQLLDTFRERIPGTGGPLQSDSDETIWAFGRHYGLLTPLLDWTNTPYIALFFALEDLCAKRRADDGGIRIERHDQVSVIRLLEWELRTAPHHTEGSLTIVRRNLDGLGRLHAQRGLFTWLRDSPHQSLEDFAAAVGRPKTVHKFVLNGREIIRDALLDLRQHGMDWRLIYPDLEGAARAANTLLERIVDIDK